MAGTETKRIIELTEASTVQSGDFIAVDSNARGTKKVPTSALATSAALTAETNARTGADEQMSERMDGIEEQTALIQNPTKTLSGALVSFTDGADMPMVACTAEIVPKQSGTGTPSPSNVRPISGWESMNLYGRGKNLIDAVNLSPTSSARWINTNGIAVKSNVQYTLSAKASKTLSNRVYVIYADKASITQSETTSGKTFLTAQFVNSDTLIFTFTANNDAYIYLFVGDVVGDFTLSDVQIEVGNTATAYAPYTGTTTPVSLGRTVYGGTLDAVSGVLTAYPFYPSYNGETLGGRWICDRAVYAEGTTPPTGSQVALISGTGTTYTLTGQEVSTLLGINNVWADSGDVEITYRRDISIVINNLESALNG